MKSVFDNCIVIINDLTPENPSVAELKECLTAYPELCRAIGGVGITLLYYAVIVKKANAVKLLLDMGSDVNFLNERTGHTMLFHAILDYDDKLSPEILTHLLRTNVDFAMNENGYSLLHAAVLCHRKTVVDSLIKQAKQCINNKNIEGLTPLHQAAMDNQIEIGELLLEEGADVDMTTMDGTTPLHLAVSAGNFKFAKLLIKYHADLTKKDNHDQSPFYLAVRARNVPLIRYFLKNGANPFNDSKQGAMVILLVVNMPDNIELLRVLFSPFKYTKKLYALILANEVEAVASYIDKRGTKFTEIQLHALSLFCIKQERFHSAHLLITHPKGVPQFERRITMEGTESPLISWSDVDVKLIFPEGATTDHQHALRDAFTKITALFLRPLDCLALLRALDKEVADGQEKLGCDFSKIQPGECIVAGSLQWPSAPTKDRIKVKNTHGLLRYLLRSKLSRYGIETQDELYTFAGFVDSEIANEIVKSGALFKEQYLSGTALSHGLWSHYIAWFLIILALEEKVLNISDNLTVLQLLQALVDVKLPDGKPTWTMLIDYLRKRNLYYDFGCPHHLNSALLTTSELPYLRGVLLNDWYRKIEKFQAVHNLYHVEPISYECIVGGQILASPLFDLFDTRMNNSRINKYYHEQSKTNGRLHEETGIVRKSASHQFSNWFNWFQQSVESQTKDDQQLRPSADITC